ncbi:MAG: ATP-binding cassette domain-containing protein [Rhizobiaceae bacterium]|nr:ATP-binding cassette domain-containing protein [Rhizobiaceae bacterium]
MLKLTDLTLHIVGRPLLENASLTLPKGARAGLVGRNGCGKTTLFKAITKDHPTETGSIELVRGCRIGQVAQEAPGTEENLLEIVLKADEELVRLQKEADTVTNPERIAEIQARLTDIEAHSAEARAATILSGLGFNTQAQKRPASSFSGGWRMRVALASVLFSRPDLLLLDEPTNYLDLEGTLWLENYISRYPGTVLIISHDRDLLNTAVDTIVHMEGQKLTLYKGGYDAFEKLRAEQRELAEKTRAKVEAQAAHMQAFVDRFRYKASKAKQAQSKLKAIAKLRPPALLEEAGTMPIRFPDPERLSASPMIKLENVNCGYSEETDILSGIKLNIDADDRIALLGANGNGKSTFAKLLSERLPNVVGNIVKAPKIKVAMFAQHQMDDLHADQTPVDHIRPLMPQAGEAQVRSKVAQMGLNHERMETKCANLSGGEKARLLLGLCTFDGPDLLILDEPTNHLDVGAREALVHGINEFKGAVILISHDRHLIDATMDRLWLVHDGKVGPYEGDMDAYRKLVLSISRKSDITKTPENKTGVSKQDNRKQAAEKRANLAPLRAKISQKEAQIQKLEEAIGKLDSSLSTPGIFENFPDKATKFAKQRAEAEKMLAKVEEEWLMLGEELEAQI